MPADRWDSGEAYESYVGRWSRAVAREFLAWLGLPAGDDWLDVGCGTGNLSRAVLARCAPTRMVGIDPSEGYVRYAREQTKYYRAEFCAGDARCLPFPDAAFDAAVSGLVLNFVPDPRSAVAEKARVTRAGGIVAGYVWDYAGEMQLMRCFWDAAAELDSAAAEADEGSRFAICGPEPLHKLFEAKALSDVQVRSIDVLTRFRDFDDYWTPFLGGQGPGPTYAMSLSEPARHALRGRIQTSLPTKPDGSIELIARAWAVKARRS
jgi:SAM-dependent methyltransferase